LLFNLWILIIVIENHLFHFLTFFDNKTDNINFDLNEVSIISE